jgi:hypothetical protein
VLPSTYGQRLPPWFPFQRAYWRGGQQAPPGGPPQAPDAARTDERALAGAAAGRSQRRQGAGDVAVQTVRLRKEFAATGGGAKVAVAGVDLSMRRGRVTALLGHNGAGKTTTIHMLTGGAQPAAAGRWLLPCCCRAWAGWAKELGKQRGKQWGWAMVATCLHCCSVHVPPCAAAPQARLPR